jgi:histidine kinase/DNA gyrase B/HSP90-like ATPase
MSKKYHPAEEVPPNAGPLVESLRDFGYTLPSALADLIDNSITAGSRHIYVIIETSGSGPHIAVTDNGRGMDVKTLVEAMRMGCQGPLSERDYNDLGRFGLGLKTAALSQGRRVTVITRKRQASEVIVRRWDIPHILQTGKWQLLKDLTPIASQYAEQIKKRSSGTAVVIEDLDRPSFLRVAPDELQDHLGRMLEAVRQHLSMVFHRFIEDGLIIKLGSTPLQQWDPFLKGKSTELPCERLHSGEIIVTPYVLPHHSKLSDEAHEQAAGPNGWNAHQGFYIYRARRLIVPGTWLNLHFRKEEHYKLARIQVDLSNSMDAAWHLNVMKSHVAAPAFLRDDFKRIAGDVRRQAAEVYRHRGERQAPSDSPPQRFVWKRVSNRTGVRYRIDRTHPVLQSLVHSGCEHDSILEQVLQLIERTLPIASMLQDPARALDGGVDTEIPENLEQYVSLVIHAEQFLIRAGIPPADARNKVLAAEPFARFRDSLIPRLNQHLRIHNPSRRRTR